jgi:hypothetical protein
MWRYVVLVLSDVSQESVTSIFTVKISANGEPALAGGCRLSHQSETTSYIVTIYGNKRSGEEYSLSCCVAGHVLFNDALRIPAYI